jgi:threonine aldolase
MTNTHRRNFLKISGLSLLPAFASLRSYAIDDKNIPNQPVKEPVVKFYADGELYDPADYIHILQQVLDTTGIEKDRYGAGGVVEKMEKKFETITGKEKAIFLPSGTMANQLAIAILSGSKSKVYVQDLSHIYRDEADAAQSVFGKRLMPLAKNGETYFTATALQHAIESLKNDEVFESGIGTVAIENPVRRADGRMVPIEEIRNINNYCRKHNIKLHLDGARLFMASAWSGISIKEYASYFDTVYISLYKYLGAAAGAVLCGDKSILAQIPHLQKIHGGSMYGNWANAAMALHKLDSIEYVLQQAIKRAASLFALLNKQQGISIHAFDGGTNIYELKLDKAIDGKKFQASMRDNWKIRMPMPDQNNKVLITVNETLLYREEDYLINAFRKSV